MGKQDRRTRSILLKCLKKRNCTGLYRLNNSNRVLGGYSSIIPKGPQGNAVGNIFFDPYIKPEKPF